MKISIVIFVTWFTISNALLNEGEKEEIDNVIGGRRGRDFGHYFPPEQEEKKIEYPQLTYPSSSYPAASYSYYAVRDGPPSPAPAAECPPNPLAPLLSNGLNFLLIKLGIIGVVKVISAILFLGFLIKIPIFLAKIAFLKAFLLPILLAPMLLYFSHAQGMMPSMRPPVGDKPSETSTEGDMSMDMGRGFEVLSESVWRSAKMLASSDRCLERVACGIGSLNNGTVLVSTIKRMTQYIQDSSPPSTQPRIRAVREAFQVGGDTGACPTEIYPCSSPQIVLRHGKSFVPLL